MPTVVKLDEKDIAILDMLCKNSRASTVEIATNTGLSPDSVARRIKNMEKDGVIEHYTIWINNTMLGQQYFKVLVSLHSIDSSSKHEIISYLSAEPKVVYIVNALGPWQLEMDVEAKSIEEVREIMRRFMKRFASSISDYTTLSIYDEYKFRFFERGLFERS